MGKTGRKWLMRRAAGASGVALVGALALGLAAPPRASAVTQERTDQPVRYISGLAGRMRADLVVRQRQVRTGGQLARAEAPAIALRVDRDLVQGKWKTTFLFRATEAPIVTSGRELVALDNPFMVARIEYDDESGEGRAFDRAGRRMPLPTEQDRRAFGVTAAERGPGWDPRFFGGSSSSLAATRPPAAQLSGHGFYVRRNEKERRQRDLEGVYGKAVGQVRGLDRYLRTERGVTTELLVAPETALPSEISVARAGALSHTELGYVAAGSAGYVRRSLRQARPAGPSTPGELLITDVVLANIELAAGGAE
jgi:hypothetical protein